MLSLRARLFIRCVPTELAFEASNNLFDVILIECHVGLADSELGVDAKNSVLIVIWVCVSSYEHIVDEAEDVRLPRELEQVKNAVCTIQLLSTLELSHLMVVCACLDGLSQDLVVTADIKYQL